MAFHGADRCDPGKAARNYQIVVAASPLMEELI